VTHDTQVNSQVTRPEEKAVLSRLVNIMVALDLRFVQEKTEDGQPWIRRFFVQTDGQSADAGQSPVDVFVTYDGKRSADIPAPRYAVRHLVATEVSRRPRLAQTAHAIYNLPPQIEARLAVQHAEMIERTRSTKPSNFFGGATT
jgi:chromosome transmission fidelity protein 18